MNVVVCVKQIPDPADPGAWIPLTKTLKRDVKLILDESDSYGVEMALQLVDTAGDGEVTLVSMAPNGEVSVCAPRWPWVPPRPSSSATTPSPAPTPSAPPRCWPRPSARPARPGPRRHRVERRLHRHRARAARRAARPPVGHLRQVGRHRRRHRQGPAPDRAGYDDVECPLPVRGVGDRRRGRAPLPVVQGDHGGQVQAGRQVTVADLGIDASATSAGPAPARRSSTSRTPRA
jgi:hypothetical protein